MEDRAASGTLLGVIADRRCPTREFVLAPGRHVLLYTDGVTEAGSRSDADRRARARRAAVRARRRRPERLVDAVEEAVVTAQPGEPRDDIALLAIAVDGEPGR